MNVTIQIVKLEQDLPTPTYAKPGDAGVDLFASLETPLTLYPGQRSLVSCGIKVAIPEGYEGQVRPRSGLAIKHGIGIVNSPGTIDAGYTGTVGCILINHGNLAYTIHRGDRICQLVVSPVTTAAFQEVKVLDETERAEGGFGHSGL